MARFSVRITYDERVHGELRTFDHVVRLEAADAKDATRRAADFFEELASASGVWWHRQIRTVEILPARRRPRGRFPKRRFGDG